MIASERMLFIMNRLNSKGIINLKEIARELDISEITVRRDFEKLEKEGKLRRVQGGATRTADLEELLDNAELTMNEKITLNREQKNLVAEYAAARVQDGDCVFLDAGTSIAPLMDHLNGRRVKIVTYNDLVVRRVNNPTAEVFVVGGKLMPYYSLYAGAVAQDVLGQFHFDVAFFGCSAVDVEQQVAYITEMQSLMMKRIALENSTRRYLLLDSSKLERHAFVKMAETTAFDEVFCERPESKHELPENFVLVG